MSFRRGSSRLKSFRKYFWFNFPRYKSTESNLADEALIRSAASNNEKCSPTKCLPHLAVIVGLAVVDKSAEIAARLNVSLNAFNMDDSKIFTSTLW